MVRPASMRDSGPPSSQRPLARKPPYRNDIVATPNSTELVDDQHVARINRSNGWTVVARRDDRRQRAIPACWRPRLPQHGRRILSTDPRSGRDEGQVECLRLGAASEGMAVSHLDASYARSASASHQRLVRSAPDAAARWRIASLGNSRRAADAQQVAEASRSARGGPEAERASGDWPSRTRPVGGAL